PQPNVALPAKTSRASRLRRRTSPYFGDSSVFMGLESRIFTIDCGSISHQPRPRLGGAGARDLSRLSRSYRMDGLCGLNRNDRYASPFVGLGQSFGWSGGAVVSEIAEVVDSLGRGRAAPRRRGEALLSPRGRTTGGAVRAGKACRRGRDQERMG